MSRRVGSAWLPKKTLIVGEALAHAELLVRAGGDL